MKLATESERSRYVAFVQSQPLPLDASVSPWKATRSNKQNAYLWRAIYQPLVEAAGHSKDKWHEYFCGERWGWVEGKLPGGRTENRPARTTTTGLDGKRSVLKADEFHDFVKFLEAELSGMGVFIAEEWQG